jgi:TPR repeat protein
LSTGKDVKVNKVEASKWYGKAADQGNSDAQLNLGILYYLGDGLAKDDKEAIKWIRMAAKQINPRAQFNLGALHLEGAGTPGSYPRALLWFSAAAAGLTGDEAKRAIMARDQLSSRMTREQLVETQAIARQCQATRYQDCE